MHALTKQNRGQSDGRGGTSFILYFQYYKCEYQQIFVPDASISPNLQITPNKTKVNIFYKNTNLLILQMVIYSITNQLF